ncbi:unnamed protein product [Trichobilharzia regenti]|nr:unnamed protein product [Trichobilharzia regenti]
MDALTFNSSNTSFAESGKTPVTQTVPVEQSAIQAWEREQDIHLEHPHLDLLDAWSSDGGSISSSSSYCSDTHHTDIGGVTSPISCDKTVKGDHVDSSRDTCGSVQFKKRHLHYLKSAGVYTSEEVIDQAIDRWRSYKDLCCQALSVLRQQLVDAYIPHAMEENKISAPKQGSSEPTGIPSDISNRSHLRQRAAKNILRHSVKTANQRHLACVSKFAIVSNRIAKWRKPTASQQCRYRDPTTTTWEKRYTTSNTSDIEPTPPPIHCIPISRSRNSSCGDFPASNMNKSIKFDDHIKSPSSRLNRSTKGHFDQSSIGSPNSPSLQIPAQYLFRCCDGGSSHKCTEPVIAWNQLTRCIYHSTTASICTDNLNMPNNDLEATQTETCKDREMNNTGVFIISALRSPIGRMSGCLSGLSAHQLGGQVINSVLDKAVEGSNDPKELRNYIIEHLEEVILGQVLTTATGQNPARQAAILAGMLYICMLAQKLKLYYIYF